MVHAALRVLGEKTGDRRVGAERLEQSDLGVRQLDEHHGHAMRGQRERRRNARAEDIAVKRSGGGKPRHDDGDMVEAADHARFLPAFPGPRFPWPRFPWPRFARAHRRTMWMSVTGVFPEV